MQGRIHPGSLAPLLLRPSADAHVLIGDPQQRAKRVKCRPARSQALVQCADMLARAIYRNYTDNDSRFYNLIKSKLENLWEF